MLKGESNSRKIQERIGSTLAVIPLTPNQWTLLSVVVAIAAAALIALQSDIAAGLALFALAAVLDMVDGAVARARGETTELGAFIDGISDRIVEALFLFAFMFYPLPTVVIDPKIWLAAAIFLGTCMPAFVRAYADHKQVISHEKALALGGICERGERLIIIIIGLAAGLFYSMDYFIYALILAALLSLITVLQRMCWIMKD